MTKPRAKRANQVLIDRHELEQLRRDAEIGRSVKRLVAGLALAAMGRGAAEPATSPQGAEDVKPKK